MTGAATFRKLPVLPPAITARVLHLVNGEHFSGAERVQSHLGRCLPMSGVTADFACLKPGRFADVLEEQDGAWGRCYRLPMRHRFDLRVASKIAKLAVAESYDFLHAHTPRTALVAAIASRLGNVPWVYHVHSPAARDSTRPWINRANAWVEARSLRHCTRLITVSESLRRDCLERGVDAERIAVVHNGVPAIRPSRISRPIPGGVWTLGMVALMRPRKGLEVVLDAIAQLKDEGYPLRLRVIGAFETAEYEQRILQRTRDLGIGDRVEPTGFTRNVPAALANVDALVLPSLFGEGLPMVVLEAMAAALPVIATRVEGTPEAIRDGVDGLLAEPGDSVSLAEAIRQMITGEIDWHAMSESAWQRHSLHFSDWAMAEATAEVYRSLRIPSDGAASR